MAGSEPRGRRVPGSKDRGTGLFIKARALRPQYQPALVVFSVPYLQADLTVRQVRRSRGGVVVRGGGD
jgi:hypothetical protein